MVQPQASDKQEEEQQRLQGAGAGDTERPRIAIASSSCLHPCGGTSTAALHQQARFTCTNMYKKHKYLVTNHTCDIGCSHRVLFEVAQTMREGRGGSWVWCPHWV